MTTLAVKNYKMANFIKLKECLDNGAYPYFFESLLINFDKNSLKLELTDANSCLRAIKFAQVIDIKIVAHEDLTENGNLINSYVMYDCDGVDSYHFGFANKILQIQSTLIPETSILEEL